jgi:hypothetical protein
MKKVPSPRLFVIMASNAHEAVVFRRGPSAWFQVVRWDTRHDRFDDGAWIRGRIYPEKCDLSPDARLLVYSVHKSAGLGTAYTDCWTGVSRTPWLNALALWPVGTTYGGGGRFESDRDLLLRLCGVDSFHPDHPPRGLRVRGGNPPVHTSDGALDGADWSGTDQRGRRTYARAGCLYLRSTRGQDRLLADFNHRQPTPVPAPEWACRALTR